MLDSSTVDEILASATDVEPMAHVGVSGAQPFRLRLNGEPHVLKSGDRIPELVGQGWATPGGDRARSKETARAAYRDALERRGDDTAPWWDQQLALSLLGGLVWFGWWKALERGAEERDWWVRAALEGARHL